MHSLYMVREILIMAIMKPDAETDDAYQNTARCYIGQRTITNKVNRTVWIPKKY